MSWLNYLWSTNKEPSSCSIDVSALYIYPVKSCAGIKVDEVTCDDIGVVFDRRWMVVERANGVFLSQRKRPSMALIHPIVDFDTGDLTLTSPNRDPVHIMAASTSSSQVVNVSVWEDTFDAAAVGIGAVDEWLSDVIGVECMLVTLLPLDMHRRPVPQEFSRDGTERHVNFSDGFPFLLISEGSLENLNERLEEPVPMERFRPNIVVRGCGSFAEDSWDEIRICNDVNDDGGVVLDVVKACGRCVLPCVDHTSAIRHKRFEPLKTLKTFRMPPDSVKDKSPLFGQNLILSRLSSVKRIRVGQNVIITRKK